MCSAFEVFDKHACIKALDDLQEHWERTVIVVADFTSMKSAFYFNEKKDREPNNAKGKKGVLKC